MQFYFPTKCESVGEMINNDNQFEDEIEKKVYRVFIHFNEPSYVNGEEKIKTL